MLSDREGGVAGKKESPTDDRGHLHRAPAPPFPLQHPAEPGLLLFGCSACRKTVLLQPFRQGEVGTTLDDLVHPTRIVFGKPSEESDKGKPSEDRSAATTEGAEEAPGPEEKAAQDKRKSEP